MPATFLKPNLEEIEDFCANEGRCPETRKKRAEAIKTFERFLVESDFEFKTLIQLVNKAVNDEIGPIQDALCQFFNAYRVGDDQSLPMKNTSLAFKSHLKCEISKMTGAKLNINQQDQFPKFYVSCSTKYSYIII